MNKFDRLYNLHKIFDGRRTILTTAELMQRLECSEPTVRRMLSKLRDELGAPLRYDRAKGGWIYSGEDDSYELPGLWFNASELHALLASHQWLTQVEPGLLGEEITPLVQRIETLLEQKQPGGGMLKNRVKLIAIGARQMDDAVFRTVAGALADGKKLGFTYRGRIRGDETRRTVSPQRLTWYRSNWYLDAWCHEKNALRSFALDRINAPQTQTASAQQIDPTEQAKHFASAYGIFSGAATHTAVLRFTPEAARWVADEKWHSQQSGRFLDDGSYELSLPYSAPTELVMDILKYGSDVEVIAPQTLRDQVRQRLVAALSQYR